MGSRTEGHWRGKLDMSHETEKKYINPAHPSCTFFKHEVLSPIIPIMHKSFVNTAPHPWGRTGDSVRGKCGMFSPLCSPRSAGSPVWMREFFCTKNSGHYRSRARYKSARSNLRYSPEHARMKLTHFIYLQLTIRWQIKHFTVMYGAANNNFWH